MKVRDAEETEVDHLAKLWYDGWQDAHAKILPAELARLRTLESFRDRLEAGLSNVRVIGPLGNPLGFCWLKGGEPLDRRAKDEPKKESKCLACA